jgi:uncharacterized cupin superfamily protein
MSDIRPVISIGNLELEPRPEAWKPTGAAAEKFHVERGHLGSRLGLTRLGINLTQVAPGRAGYPFHSHRVNDELFFILSGRGELRLGSARHAVKEGDVVGCPAGGPETAHQLINTGTEPLRYLSMSSNDDPEVCEYPDSDKIGVWAGEGEGALMHLTRRGAKVDYWDGE